MATYVNNLRLTELATGEGSGTWGTTTNTNLELIGEALGYGSEAVANASTHTITVADGTADSARSFYLKLTGGGQACTVTLAPNTLSKVWMVENTTNSTLTFSQGSGANVAIAAGAVKMIATDGAGSGAVVYDLLVDTDLTGTTTVVNLTSSGTIDAATVEFNSLSGTGSVAITDILDQDNMSSNSATALATQQSIKAYVDSSVASFDTLAEVLAQGNTTGSTDIEVTTAQKVQFRDSAIYINSSADGQLDIVADTEIQIAATTIDINGAINASGEIIAASLDISGNIDVDGTTNLDVVDIDGAVNMASTLQVDGAITTNADLNIITSSTSGFKVGDNGATAGALITAYQGSSNTNLRTLEIAAQVFNVKVGEPTGTTSTTAFSIASDGAATFTPSAGGHAVFNENSVDADFRVESNGNANMFYIDGGNDAAFFGGSDKRGFVNIETTPVNYSSGVFNAPHLALQASSQPDDNDGFVGITFATSDSDNYGWSAGAERTSSGVGDFVFTEHNNSATGSEKLRITQSGAATFSSTIAATGATLTGVLELDASGNIPTNGIGLHTNNFVYLKGGSSGLIAASQSGGENFRLNANGIVFNEDSGDLDFRVESNGNANMLFVDGGNNAVAFGTNNTGAGVHTIRLDGTDVSGSTDGATVTKAAVLNLANFDGASTNNTVMLLGSTSASTVGQIASGIGFTRENGADWGTQLRFYVHPTATSDLDALDEVARFTTSEFVVNEQSMNYDFRVESDGNANMLFVDGGTSRVHIGTTSGSGGNLVVASNSSANGIQILARTADDYGFLNWYNAAGSSQYGAIAGIASGLLHFDNAGAERMRVTSAGVIVNEGGNDVDFRVESDALTHALFVEGSTGQLRVNTSSWPSNTFGDAAGRHIVGGPNEPLFVLWNEANAAANNISTLAIGAKSATATTAFGGGWIRGGLENNSDSDGFLGFYTTKDAGANSEQLRISSSGAMSIASSLTLSTNNNAISMTDASGGTTRMFILNSANATYLGPVDSYAGGAMFYGASANVTGHNMYVGGVDRFNISSSAVVVNEASADVDFRVESDAFSSALAVEGSSGKVNVAAHFGIGKTSAGEQQSAGSGFFFVPGSSGYYSHISTVDTANFSSYFNRKTQTGGFFNFAIDNTGVGSVTYNGSATVYSTSSDKRLKENIADADDAGSKIDAMQVRKFDWKRNGHHQEYGMVAQELLPISPDSIAQGETEEDMMSVDYSTLVPMLIKEIQSLRQRVAQLEE